MAKATAGIATITVQFESKTSQGFGKFSDGLRDEAAALLARLETLGVRGVDVVDSDVLVGQSYVLSGNGSAVTADDIDPDLDEGEGGEPEAPQPAPKRRGRPPGSKNKPKETAVVEEEEEAPRRPRAATGKKAATGSKKAAGKKAAGPRRRA